MKANITNPESMDSWLEYTPLAGLASAHSPGLICGRCCRTLTGRWRWRCCPRCAPRAGSPPPDTEHLNSEDPRRGLVCDYELSDGFSFQALVSSKREKYNSLNTRSPGETRICLPRWQLCWKVGLETGNCVQFILINLSTEIFWWWWENWMDRRKL